MTASGNKWRVRPVRTEGHGVYLWTVERRGWGGWFPVNGVCEYRYQLSELIAAERLARDEVRRMAV